MTIERKLLSTSPSGGATDVAEVFSTFLYTGNSGTNVINNGIDLDGEGGMVWIKCRNVANNHYIVDTERGASKVLYGLGTAAETTSANSLTSFNSNGFTLGADDTDGINKNTRSQVAWTFRKAPKFFDVVTYTGNGATSRNIPHSLGVAPGMMIVKRYDGGATNWFTYHISTGNNKYLYLNDTRASAVDTEPWAATTPTDSVFTVGLGNTNGNTNSFVAYLFADNSAEDAEDQVIKCGSFTSSSANQVINLGWEPQFVLIKSSSNAMSWYIFDTMRGIVTSGNDSILAPNDALAEETASQYIDVTPTGFISHFNALAGSRDYIYIAIRAPMMVEPEAATDVFAVAARTGASGSTPSWVSGFVTDMTIQIEAASSNHTVGTRLLGGNVRYTDATNAESGGGGKYTWDYMTGFSGGTGAAAANKELMFKRAKGFMDVVAYKGTGVTGLSIPHSLGVVPEMMIMKGRSNSGNWVVYHKVTGVGSYLSLNADNDLQSSNLFHSTPTDTNFQVNESETDNNYSGRTYTAYLFATLTGVSKVGSYTGNGSYQTIPCGFAAGARFILIRRWQTSSDGDWYVWDSLNGIVAGNDPHSSLNTSAAQVTNDDAVDPHSSGFIVNQNSPTNINVSSGTYIFYAIA